MPIHLKDKPSTRKRPPHLGHSPSCPPAFLSAVPSISHSPALVALIEGKSPWPHAPSGQNPLFCSLCRKTPLESCLLAGHLQVLFLPAFSLEPSSLRPSGDLCIAKSDHQTPSLDLPSQFPPSPYLTFGPQLAQLVTSTSWTRSLGDL